MGAGEWNPLSAAIVVATYLVVAAFYLRLGVHALRWLEATLRAPPAPRRSLAEGARSIAGAALDVLLLRRLFLVNPALWTGEWLFHLSLALVILRHLRYFTSPVPAWVMGAQTPGWIAGWLLPAAVLIVLAIRLLPRSKPYASAVNLLPRSKPYASAVNLLLLVDVLAIAGTGLLLATRHRVDLVAVKRYALGVVTFSPSPPPPDLLLAAHLALVFVLVLYVPSHVFTAPLTMLDARRRDRELLTVLHDG